VHGADQGQGHVPLSFHPHSLRRGAAATAVGRGLPRPAAPPGLPPARRAGPGCGSRGGRRPDPIAVGRRLLRARGRQRLETGAVLGAHQVAHIDCRRSLRSPEGRVRRRLRSRGRSRCRRSQEQKHGGDRDGARRIPRPSFVSMPFTSPITREIESGTADSACTGPSRSAPAAGALYRGRRRPRSVGQVFAVGPQEHRPPDTGTPGRRPPARARGRNPPEKEEASPRRPPSRRERLSHTHSSVLNCRTVRNCQSSKMVDHRISSCFGAGLGLAELPSSPAFLPAAPARATSPAFSPAFRESAGRDRSVDNRGRGRSSAEPNPAPKH